MKEVTVQHVILKFSFIALILLTGCITRYSPEEMEFTADELSVFAEYNQGDTIFYQSNLGDIDTITILNYDGEISDIKSSTFTSPMAMNTKWLKIKHLPIDRWHGLHGLDNPEIVYQNLISINKNPEDKSMDYAVSFKNFYSISDDTIGTLKSDTLRLNDLVLENYFIINHSYPERIKKEKDIAFLYWTNEKGLVGYTSKDGEIWTLKH